jgi:hypothetical protein
MTTNTTILRRYVRLVAEVYPDRPAGTWGDLDYPRNTDHVEDPHDLNPCENPFVLVERSHYGQTWITLWSSADEAVQYHESQEYAEDWRVDRLVDLRTDTEYRLSAVPVQVTS